MTQQFRSYWLESFAAQLAETIKVLSREKEFAKNAHNFPLYNYSQKGVVSLAECWGGGLEAGGSWVGEGAEGQVGNGRVQFEGKKFCLSKVALRSKVFRLVFFELRCESPQGGPTQ